MDIKYDKNYITVGDTILSYTHDVKRVHVPSVINGNAIRRIGMGAFKGNRCTTEVTIDNGINEIGHKAFSNCEKLRSIIFPDSLELVEEDAFRETPLDSVTFWLRIPYNKYLSVREGSIKLVDGRYIFDPQTLGEEMNRLIHILMPEASKGSFRVDPQMGCLFSDKSEPGKRNLYIFEKYCIDKSISSEDLVFEGDAIGTKIRNHAEDIWFEHSDEYDDAVEKPGKDMLETVMLFCVQEGMISDSDINLKFVLSRNRYYFQRGIKIICNGSTYYHYVKEYFTNNDNHPYFRVLSNEIYDINGARIDCGEEALNKYMFLQELI